MGSLPARKQMSFAASTVAGFREESLLSFAKVSACFWKVCKVNSIMQRASGGIESRGWVAYLAWRL